MSDPKYAIGDRVRKHSGTWWEGRIVGGYSTTQTDVGYAIQLDMVPNGPVQIYPEVALSPAKDSPTSHMVGQSSLDLPEIIGLLQKAKANMARSVALGSNFSKTDVNHAAWMVQTAIDRLEAALALATKEASE